MACRNYKELTVNYCPDAFVFSGYDSQVFVQWEFTNLYGNKIKGDAVTSSAGVLTLPVDGTIGLTKELFQHFNGPWEFRSYGIDALGNDDLFVFCNGGELYDFTLFNFQLIDPLPVPNNINVLFETCTET